MTPSFDFGIVLALGWNYYNEHSAALKKKNLTSVSECKSIHLKHLPGKNYYIYKNTKEEEKATIKVLIVCEVISAQKIRHRRGRPITPT